MSAERIDWSQLYYPGPTRCFTPEEMARAGQDRPSRTLILVVLVQILCTAPALSLVSTPMMRWVMVGLVSAFLMLLFGLAAWCWAYPTRRRLNLSCLGVLTVHLSISLAAKWLDVSKEQTLELFVASSAMMLLGTIALWVITAMRSNHIAARLRELDERDQAISMALQLATAQVQPHFLFNSLASLQHWVSTGDARAAPLLTALTAYLRATLPLFERRSLSLAQELEAVRHYLAVLELRFGERLRSEVQAAPETLQASLPPGVLLTLVENAVEHGLAPKLQGGEVKIQALTTADGRVRITVCDDGVGLPDALLNPSPSPEPANGRGVGLRNTRTRLQQLHGAAAELRLFNPPSGGACAELLLPPGPSAHP
jgi:hypothetical protein